METEKNKFFVWCFYRVKAKIGECSALLWYFNFGSKLVQTTTCVQFYFNQFSREVNNISNGLYTKFFFDLK